MTLANSSRAVRTLSKASDHAAAKHTLPSSSVAKFTSRALNTKGAVPLSRTRGWQRKAGKCAPRFPGPTLVTRKRFYSEYRRHENGEWTGGPFRAEWSSVVVIARRMLASYPPPRLCLFVHRCGFLPPSAREYVPRALCFY